jgi:hypothetical protein
MLDEGRRQERGDHPGLRWILGRVEEADLEPPYALVAAGDSLDWTDWETTLPRLRDVLAPEGALVILQRAWGTGTPEELELVRRHSTLQDFQPYELIDELESRDLFRAQHRLACAERWRPTIEEYVESRHAQVGFARATMGAERSAAFDAELAELLRRLVAERRVGAQAERLQLQVTANVTWGRPPAARTAPV